MSAVHSPSTGRRYRIKRVSPRSTVHNQLRHSSVTDLPALRKRGPVGAATDEELVALIRQQIDTSPFHGERNSHTKRYGRPGSEGVVLHDTDKV